MSKELIPVPESRSNPSVLADHATELVSFTLGEQIFGIPVLQVEDILPPQKIVKVPLAPTQVCGAMNLRGRIATVISLRRCLNLPDEAASESMFITVEDQGELYGLMVDHVGDVMNLPAHDFEPNPSNLDPAWERVASGIFHLADHLLLVLDPQHLLKLVHS